MEANQLDTKNIDEFGSLISSTAKEMGLTQITRFCEDWRDSKNFPNPEARLLKLGKLSPNFYAALTLFNGIKEMGKEGEETLRVALKGIAQFAAAIMTICATQSKVIEATQTENLSLIKEMIEINRASQNQCTNMLAKFEGYYLDISADVDRMSPIKIFNKHRSDFVNKESQLRELVREEIMAIEAGMAIRLKALETTVSAIREINTSHKQSLDCIQKMMSEQAKSLANYVKSSQESMHLLAADSKEMELKAISLQQENQKSTFATIVELFAGKIVGEKGPVAIKNAKT
jgi:hypothetical protein